MKSSLIKTGLISLLAIFMLTACGDQNDEKNNADDNTDATEENIKKEMEHNDENVDMKEDMEHGNMNHDDTGEIPDGLKEAENPTYKVGDKVTLKTEHMEGMNGAEATIVGAYDTTAYTVTYTPENGGNPVKNHKWVIHEEIEDANGQTYKKGDEVKLDAAHMQGMDDAKAIIESAEDTTVYMVDYTPTTGGNPVKNHKWVTEEEIAAK